MFQEELEKIVDVEKEALSIKKEAKREARKIVTEAKNDAEIIISDAQKQAREIYGQYVADGEQIADEEYNKAIADIKTNQSVTIQQARLNLGVAVDKVEERIVSGKWQ